jgi:glutaredoxin-related protein
MLDQVTDRVRFAVAAALASSRGNQYRPLRLLREALGTANDLCGKPFCTPDELSARRATGARDGSTGKREAAPVMLYFDGKDHRTKKKMEELLGAREIAFQVLDVGDDEATRSWALATAKQAEFPLLFIAGEPVGGLHELTQLDVNGDLKRRVLGE